MTYLKLKYQEEYRTQRMRECEGGNKLALVILLFFCALNTVKGEIKKGKKWRGHATSDTRRLTLSSLVLGTLRWFLGRAAGLGHQ